MGGHPPDSCRYTRSARRSQEVVGVWLNSSRIRAISKRIFRARGSKPNSASTLLSGPGLSRATEPNSARTAGLPAFVEGGNSIGGYGGTRSHGCAEDEVGYCFSISSYLDRSPPGGADPPSGSRPARLPPARSMPRSRWRHSSWGSSPGAGRNSPRTASDRPVERLSW